MKVTGEIAVRLAERYGTPIHKEVDQNEGRRESTSRSKTREWILRHGNPETIFAEAEPELINTVRAERTAG
jgi:hypothetical protein